MKTAKTIGLVLLGIVIGLVISASFSTAQAQKASPSPAATYLVVQGSRDPSTLETMLNNKAREGWRFKAIEAGPIVIFER